MLNTVGGATKRTSPRGVRPVLFPVFRVAGCNPSIWCSIIINSPVKFVVTYSADVCNRIVPGVHKFQFILLLLVLSEQTVV